MCEYLLATTSRCNDVIIQHSVDIPPRFIPYLINKSFQVMSIFYGYSLSTCCNTFIPKNILYYYLMQAPDKYFMEYLPSMFDMG